MSEHAPRPPVIVIGMHRSGTSLLTRTLEGMGLFMGRVRGTRNEEADFTKQVNDWMLVQSGSSWFTPEHIDDLLDDPVLFPMLCDYVRGMTGSLPSWRFLGPGRFLRYRSMHRVTEPWGWKDPRNTFTLPVWLSVFPEARVLHIKRHGVDVARSLLVRRNRAVERLRDKFARQHGLYVHNPLAPGRRRFGHEPSCGTLAKAFDLWERYLDRAARHVAALGDRALEISYEDLLGAPDRVLPEVVAFCGLDVGGEAVAKAARQFNADRAQAYRKDPELMAYAESVDDRLARFGYGA